MSDFRCTEGHLFEVHAGPHDREHTIVRVPCRDCLCAGLHWLEELDAAGEVTGRIPAQCCGPSTAELCGTMTFILPHLAAGETRRYRVAAAQNADFAGQATVQRGEGQWDFFLGEHLFTSYVVRPEVARPYCYPVLGPGGVGMTNLAPADHPHHKSMYLAHGAVNGYDNWSELEGHARTVPRSGAVLSSGPVYAELSALNDWESPRGEKLLAEAVRLRVYHLPAHMRVMDWEITWTAAYGGVFFGDTKEAGTLSVRVAESLEESRGGRIVNAYGAVGEAECWGKPAPWVDYSGTVEGAQVGLALFDHPRNLRYPTPWHVRSYGLFTANCWGLHDFTGDWSVRGDYALPAGQALRWRFRVYLHEGDVRQGKVAQKWLDFAYPPRVEPL